jgi:hypothetical protein
MANAGKQPNIASLQGLAEFRNNKMQKHTLAA